MTTTPIHWLVPLTALLLTASGTARGELLSASELLNLKQMGYSDQEIRAEVSKAGGTLPLSAQELEEVKAAGIGDAALQSLGSAGDAPPEPGPAPTATAGEPLPPPAAEPLPENPPATTPPTVAGTDPQAAPPADASEFSTPQFPPVQPSEPPQPPTAQPLAEPPVPPPAALQPPVPLPAAIPLPSPVEPVPLPMPVQPSLTEAPLTSHQLQAGQSALFNLPFNNTSGQQARVDAGAAGGSWLSVTPASVPVAAGGSTSFQIRLSAQGLAPGRYQGSVTLLNAGSGIRYPFALDVTPLPPPMSRYEQGTQPPAQRYTPSASSWDQSQAQPYAPPASRWDQPQGRAYDAPAPAWDQSPYPGSYGMRPEAGVLDPQLVGEWVAVIPGMWGRQSVLYFDLSSDGEYTYSVFQSNMMRERSYGQISSDGQMLEVLNEEGELMTYSYRLWGGRLVIDMPEWGGNVRFSRQ